jgi:23S rRNA pseudouridine1911/1915/1917 synthase
VLGVVAIPGEGGGKGLEQLPRRAPRLRLVALAEDAGTALLAFVSRRGGIGEHDARAAIARGAAFLRGRRVRDPHATVHAGDRVEVDLREPAAPELPRLLHLDPLVIAVDKPAGVLAQEGRAGGPALPELCSLLLRERGEAETALLVHRLDRGTTGVTVLARTRAAQAALLEEFREGRVTKEYLALCLGEPRADELASDAALSADPLVPGKRRPDPRGEPARTRFRVLRRLQGAALVAAFPETGRTHQIRAHLASLGLPIAGDARYGGPRAITLRDGRRLDVARPLLHALSLALRHPGGSRLTVEAPEPSDLSEAVRFFAR